MLTSKTSRPALLAAILFAITLAGCSDDAQPAEVPVRPQSALDNPIEQIPREELYGASAVDNLWSPRYELEVLDLPPAWNGARFAILSDFQLGLWEENEKVATAAVQRAVDANPDVIFLLGDYIARGDDTESLQRVLAPLRGRRAMAVLGEGDVRSDSLEARITGVLTANGVQVLKNSVANIDRGGETIQIAGLDPDLVGEPYADQQYILATLGTPGRTPILLTHAAPMITRAPMRRYPITIAGNTFCGEVEVPDAARITWLRNEVFPNGSIPGTDRLFRVQGSTVLVTCGVGYSFIPLRFGAAPEVPLLTLARLGGAPPAEAAVASQDTLNERYTGEQPDSAN
jgi:predicted MPP superfamily phosphohydrolase